MEANFFIQFFTNEVLIATFFAWLFAQGYKIFLHFLKKEKFKLIWFVNPGGFPSSHTASVVALTASIGLRDGFDSSVFGLSLILTVLIIFDALVNRRIAGQHAIVLNKILEDFYQEEEKKLKEVLGHNFKEVLGGAILGYLIAIFFYYFF